MSYEALHDMAISSINDSPNLLTSKHLASVLPLEQDKLLYRLKANEYLLHGNSQTFTSLVSSHLLDLRANVTFSEKTSLSKMPYPIPHSKPLFILISIKFSNFRKFVCTFILYLCHTLQDGFHEAKALIYIVCNCITGLEEVLTHNR